MENREILGFLKLTASLLELHEANEFKVRAYNSAVYNLDKTPQSLANLTQEELEKLDGVNKSLASKIVELTSQGTFTELRELLEETPKGVIEMLDIKGIGPKKIRTVWKDLQITNKKDLLQACLDDKISGLKGFGKKTQESVKQSLLFSKAQEGKYLYAEVEEFAIELEKTLKAANIGSQFTSTGGYVRKVEIIDKLQYLAASGNPTEVHKALDAIPQMKVDHEISGPFAWRGTASDFDLRIEVLIAKPEQFTTQQYILSSGEGHLRHVLESGETILQKAKNLSTHSEEDLTKQLGIPLYLPEVREGYLEFDGKLNQDLLISDKDITGSLHNHSLWSDGRNSIEEMANACKELGWNYFGISDHSVTAFYAQGLDEDRVEQQHREIDELNSKLSPFKIFKGIESDILNDGSLDYSDDVLKSFDFIVASIHSNLKMDKEKSMMRLIKAIENPYTTILGHMTGRLLLRREGYPVDHKKIIDACAANNVIIEINANPRRLDIDWRWIPYCLEKGVMLSINPDAHQKAGLLDTHYGVMVGRKGGLTKDMTFNALPVEKIEAHFKSKRG